jgi:hypothetical protein
MVTGTKSKLIGRISTLVYVVAILVFILVPIEVVEAGGIYLYTPTLSAKIAIAVLSAMGILPSLIWLNYVWGMEKAGLKGERDRGILLAVGFLLVALGELILFPFFGFPLIVCTPLNLVGVILLYVGFTLEL